MFKSAAGYRQFYQDMSGSVRIAAATGDTTLATARSASHTVYVQKIIAHITTDAAQSWSFEDTNGTPKQIAEIPASPGDNTEHIFDFGDAGIPLTEGKNFVLNVSAAGLAGELVWYAYQKITAAVAAGSTN